MEGDKTQDVKNNIKDIQTVNEFVDDETTESGGIIQKDKFKFIEDLEQIGKIFDKNLFDRISEVEHIKQTEQQLEEMKVTITDKKRL